MILILLAGHLEMAQVGLEEAQTVMVEEAEEVSLIGDQAP